MEKPEGLEVVTTEVKTCAEIFRMFDNGVLNVNPYFQRDVIWTNKLQTMWISSIINGFPMQQIFLTTTSDNKDGVLNVLDGKQRTSSIIKLFLDTRWRLSSSIEIDERLRGKIVENLDQDIIDCVENTEIPITFIKYDDTNKAHLAFLSHLHRTINTTGRNLSLQERRNCSLGGPFNKMLKNIVQYENFRNLLDLKPNKSYRSRYEEVVLASFALLEDLKRYNGSRGKFLDKYMEGKLDVEPEHLNQYEKDFREIVDTLYTVMLNNNPMPKPARAKHLFLEALFVGMINNIEKVRKMDANKLAKKFNTLMQHKTNRSLFETPEMSEANRVKKRVKASTVNYS